MTSTNGNNDTMGFSDCTLLNDSHHIPMDKKAQIAVPIVFGFILLTGLIGNASVILIVLKCKQMRTIPNIYLVSLALGDFLFLLLAVPFSAFSFTFPVWHFGMTLCKVNYFMETLSLGVSVFTLTLLSVDRYLAISHPMRKRSAISMKKTVCLALSVWIISLALAIPDAIGSEIKVHPHYCVSYCDPYPEAWGFWYMPFHVTYRFILFFAVPLIIIWTCYSLMARTLLSSNSHILVEVSSNRHGSSRTNAARTQVAKLVLSFVFIFIICWLPRHIYLLGNAYDLFDFNQFWYVFKVLGFCLAFSNSCMNPIALYLQSEQFRKYFRRYLCRCCPHKMTKSGTDHTPSTVVSQCHYTKGLNEDTSTTYFKMYKD